MSLFSFSSKKENHYIIAILFLTLFMTFGTLISFKFFVKGSVGSCKRSLTSMIFYNTLLLTGLLFGFDLQNFSSALLGCKIYSPTFYKTDQNSFALLIISANPELAATTLFLPFASRASSALRISISPVVLPSDKEQLCTLLIISTNPELTATTSQFPSAS